MLINKRLKNIKKVIFVWLLGFTFFWLSWSFQYVHATGSTSNQVQQEQAKKDSLAELSVTLDVFLNFLYIVLWPMLAITGMALDNTLVYGSVFHLDQILRQIWTVVMYLSFVMLWVTILWDLAKDAIGWKDISTKVKEGIPRWIWAGILIPMSWFLMGVVIDLSTIAIYQVWNIPLTIMQTDSNLDQKLLEAHSTVDLNSAIWVSSEWGFRYSTYYSCQEENFVPCKISNYQVNQQSQLDYINQFASSSKIDVWSINTEYCVMTPTQLYKLNYQWWWTWAYTSITWENFIKWLQDGQVKMSSCNGIKDIIQRSQTMVWPLYTIYWSLLNFASINHTDSSKPIEAEVVIFLIKSIVWLLLIIPLIWLAVMSIWRVGMLWLAIAFSPLIVMFQLFKNNKKLSELQWNMNFKWWIDAKFSLSNIIKLIFQPVLTVFALGLSLILLSATTSMLTPDTAEQNQTATNQLLRSFDMETSFDEKNNSQCLTIEWYTTTCVTDFPEKFSSTVFADYFSWIIANIIGILVMRNLLFASMKWNEITDNMVWAVEKVWNNFLKNNIPAFGWFTYESMFGDEGISKTFKAITDKFTEDQTAGRAQTIKKRIESRTDGTFNKMNNDIKYTVPKWADGKDITDEKQILASASENFTKKVSEMDFSKWVQLSENDLSNLGDYKRIWWYSGANLAEWMWDKRFWDFMNATPEWNGLLQNWLSIKDKKEIGKMVWEKYVDAFINNKNNAWNLLELKKWEKDGRQIAAKIVPDALWNNMMLYQADITTKNNKEVFENLSTYSTRKTNIGAINTFVNNYPHMRDDVKKYYDDPNKYEIDEVNKTVKLKNNRSSNNTNNNAPANNTALANNEPNQNNISNNTEDDPIEGLE